MVQCAWALRAGAGCGGAGAVGADRAFDAAGAVECAVDFAREAVGGIGARMRVGDG